MKVRLVMLLALIPTLAAPSAWAEVFGAKERVLDNGLRVVAVEIDRAPVVTHMVWYRVGAMDEPPGKSGIAHFLEHLMFKGTETRGPGEFSERVARHGGRDNAFTAQDYTGYFQSVASDRLDMVMEMEADRMVNLKIAEDHFEPEKLVVLEERAQRTDSDPSSILWEQSAAAFYRNHPYAIPIIGWRHEIEALTIRDALDFYEDWYAPNNAIVVVSGDVSAEEVFALAEKHYGPIPARDLPERPALIEPPLTVETRVTLADPRVRQPSLVIRKPAPSWGTSDDKNELYALDVLMEILGGGNTGLLSRALVVEDGVAVAAGAWFSGSNRGPGHVGLYVSPADGVDLEAAEAALRAELSDILERGVTEEEVARARIRLQDAAATARDSLSGPARAIGASLIIGAELADIETWPDRIGAVTADAVNAAARRVLTAPGEVVNVLLPADQTTAAVPAPGGSVTQ
jgi:zinc protease